MIALLRTGKGRRLPLSVVLLTSRSRELDVRQGFRKSDGGRSHWNSNMEAGCTTEPFPGSGHFDISTC